jgi:hypothetical protein
MSQELNQEQVEQLGKELVEGSEAESAIKNEEIQVSEEEALILRYEQLKDVVVKVSTQLSSRSLGRVLRAAMRHPFEREPKFVNALEKMAFDAFTSGTDIKFMYINKMLAKMEAQGQNMKQGLDEAAQAASEVTESSESENNS